MEDRQFVESLLQQVQVFLCFYVIDCEDYKDKLKKENAWKSIGTALERIGNVLLSFNFI